MTPLPAPTSYAAFAAELRWAYSRGSPGASSAPWLTLAGTDDAVCASPCLPRIHLPALLSLGPVLLPGLFAAFVPETIGVAAAAFDLNAIDYIQKPIQKDRLEKAIAKASIILNSTPAKKQYAQFNTDKGKALLLFDENHVYYFF